MTTDENIMHEMLDRATNPTRDTVDELGVQMFCMVVRSNAHLVHKAQDMIVAKIRSSNVTESTRAIALLEECMTKCGSEFQDEVAKFRFLNDLIRLVSKKYQGAETPTSIKQRIMECLLLWTTEFPLKAKIREAYDMLSKEGGVEYVSTPAATAKRESILGIDEKVLSKLIQSGDPENFKRANLLIQYRVSQESRRTELVLQHKCELQEVETTVVLLNQMLDTFESEVGSEKYADGSETMNLIRELYLSCKKHKPILKRLPELIEQTDEQLIADTLEANDLLQAVIERYKNTVTHPQTKGASAPSASTASHADLLTELLGDTMTQRVVASVANGVTTPLKPDTSATVKSPGSTLAELQDIFENVAKSHTEMSNQSALFENLDLLEPVNVFVDDKSSCEANKTDKPTFRELREIDALSEELFKKNLPDNDRVGSFKKESDKLTLNDMVKEKTNVKNISPASAKSTPTKSFAKPTETTAEIPFDLGSSSTSLTTSMDDEKMLADSPKRREDDLMLSTESESNEIEKLQLTKEELSQPLAAVCSINELQFKHLSDITIELDDITATADERLLLDDDDVKITLNLTEDRPSKQVSVIVISAVNKSKVPVKEFHFEASVRKPCKVRLLPPTDCDMPPHKSFRPAIPINQVMLLLNPTGKAVDVTCIVGYKLGDDPDPIKESIVAKDIPSVE